MNELGPERSLINITDSEWRTREINVMALVRSFLSQISPGQDLTKISLPSVLCHPFSMLELISHRELLLFHILFELDQISDPLERFMIIVKWFISLTRTETLEKKPYNPVIGETHMCWVDHTPPGGPAAAGIDSPNLTEFISEQVSHHPPVSAFYMHNAQHQLTLEGVCWFGVKLSTNSATVSTSGGVTITTNQESFELTKVVPDLSINNTVMPGKKYIMWSGEVKISCPLSGYIATINTEERFGRVNGISGFVIQRDDPNKRIYTIDGVCGQKTFYWNPDKSKEKILLLDHSLLKEAFIHYLPRALRSEFDSLKLWVPVSDAIIKNDMATADAEKKKIEAAQRIRQAEKISSGKQDEGTYFKRDPDSLNANWQFRNNVSLADLIRAPAPGSEAHPPEVPVSIIAAPQDLNNNHHNNNTNININNNNNNIPSPLILNNLHENNNNNINNPQSNATDSIPIPIPKADHSSNDSPISGTPPDIYTDPDVGSSGNILREDGEQSAGGGVGNRDRSKSKIKPMNGSEVKIKKKELKKVKKEIVQKAKALKGGLIPPQDILKQGPIKIRNSFKKWNMRYGILLEGRLIYFTSQQDAEKEYCKGIIMLQNCYVTERPSKKEGFCLKIFNTLNHPIFSRQDLRGKPLNKPLGVFSNYCLIRLKSKEEGKDWLNYLIKAIPDFDQTKARAMKDNDTDSSDGPDDAEDSDDHKDSSIEDTASVVPPITIPEQSTLPTGQVKTSPHGGGSPRKVPVERISKVNKKPEPGTAAAVSKKNLSPDKPTVVDQNRSRSGDLIGTRPPVVVTHSLTAEELKDHLSKLLTTLKEDLNKVIETKVENQGQQLSSKIDSTESRIAYAVRLPAPAQPLAGGPASTQKSLKQNVLFILRSQFSLNTVLLLVIIYLLLSILWML